MKLQELAVANPTKQAAKVFESYFGNRVDFQSMTHSQASTMLKRVRAMVAEHRRTPEFHKSEQNPAYLKLVVMEQALATRVMEQDVDMTTASPTAPADPADAQKQKAMMSTQLQQKKRQIQDAIRAKQTEIQQLQKQMNSPVAMENRRSTLRQRLEESEVQQAQVVLAAQDMVDEVQKMSEQVSAMQFKDLPALVDSIKNQVGPDQAMQFNTDATGALAGLLQNLQGARQQLDQALGVVTGQAPTVPGEPEMDAGALPAELPPVPDEEVETDIEIDDEQDSGTLAASLGRGRR
jgi:osmotically-inducible protein OsmY